MSLPNDKIYKGVCVSIRMGKDLDEFVLAGNNKFLLGDYKGAIISFTKAIMASPLHPASYSSRAYAKLEMRDYDGALYDCQQALNLMYMEEQINKNSSHSVNSQKKQSEYARIFSTIGIAKLLQGNKDDALVILHSARLLGWQDAEDIIKSYYKD